MALQAAAARGHTAAGEDGAQHGARGDRADGHEVRRLRGRHGHATDGLLHVSQLSNSIIENIEDVVKVGQKVTVRVTEVNLERANFSLSMKPAAGEGDADEAAARPPRFEETRAKGGAFQHPADSVLDKRGTTMDDVGDFCHNCADGGKVVILRAQYSV